MGIAARILGSLAKWYVELWEILASVLELGAPNGWLRRHGLLALVAGSLVLSVAHSRYGRRKLVWLKTPQEIEAAYRSIIRGARHYIISVGSHSQCPAVLDEIEPRMHSTPDLIHIRILPERPNENVRAYLCKLLRHNPNSARGPNPTLCIGFGRPADLGNVQICANENTAIFVFSLGALFNGDTLCFEVHDKYLCEHVVTYAKGFYETRAQKDSQVWEPDATLSAIVRELNARGLVGGGGADTG